MLYPSSELLKRRKAFFDVNHKAESTISEAQINEGLSFDPLNPALLFSAATHNLNIGNVAKAQRFISRGLQAAPHLPLFYLLQQKAYEDQLDLLPFQMAIRKGTIYQKAWLDYVPPVIPGNEETNLSDLLYLKQTATLLRKDHEERRRKGELGPDFLFQEILDQAHEGPVDAALIEEAVQSGETLLRLFDALIHAYTDPIIEPPEEQSVAFAVALLGEMGGSSHLSDLLELIENEESDIQYAAEWSFPQLAQRFPDQAIAAIREYAIDCDVDVFPDLVDQVWHLRNEKHAIELLDVLLDSVVDVVDGQRERMFLTIADAMVRVKFPGAKKRLREAFKEARRKLDPLVSSVLDDLLDGITLDVVELPEEFVNLSIKEFCADLMEDWIMIGDEAFDDDDDDDNDDEQFHLSGPPPYDPEGKVRQAENKVQEVLDKVIGKEDLKQALSVYSVGFDKLSDLMRKQAKEGDSFMDWFLYDYRSKKFPDGVTAKCVATFPQKFDQFETQLLLDWSANSYTSLLEVQDIVPATGLNVKDLFTDDEFFVNDITTSKIFSVFSCFTARVVPFEGLKLFTGTLLDVKRPHVAEAVKWGNSSKTKKQSWPVFLKSRGPSLRLKILSSYDEFANNVQTVNFEGDPIEFSEAFYKILDTDGVIKALESHPAFDRYDEDGKISFAWLDAPKPGSDSRRSFGSIELDGTQLKISCNSRNRLATGRKLVEQILPGKLERSVERIKSIQEARKELGERKPSSEETTIPPEVQREFIENHYKQHYSTWIDMSLPALEGKTPRQAAKSKKHRPLLEDLLKGFLSMVSQQRKDGLPAFDFSDIIRELGLDHLLR